MLRCDKGAIRESPACALFLRPILPCCLGGLGMQLSSLLQVPVMLSNANTIHDVTRPAQVSQCLQGTQGGQFHPAAQLQKHEQVHV